MDNETKSELLYHELISELNHVPILEVNITQLCQNAGVSRAFYYRNFSSLEEIIEKRLKNESAIFLRQNKHLINSTQQFALQFFTLFKQASSDVQIIVNANLEFLIHQTFILSIKQFVSNRATNSMNEYQIAYRAGGLFELMITWVQHNCPESPEEITSIFLNSI